MPIASVLKRQCHVILHPSIAPQSPANSLPLADRPFRYRGLVHKILVGERTLRCRLPPLVPGIANARRRTRRLRTPHPAATRYTGTSGLLLTETTSHQPALHRETAREPSRAGVPTRPSTHRHASKPRRPPSIISSSRLCPKTTVKQIREARDGVATESRQRVLHHAWGENRSVAWEDYSLGARLLQFDVGAFSTGHVLVSIMLGERCCESAG